MSNQQIAIPLSPIAAPARRRNMLAAALRRALAEPRPGPRIPARLLALGLAAHGVGAWAAGPFPPEFELSSLLPANGGDGSTGFVLRGIDAVDFSGYSVSAAGDVNGDGLGDVLVGAYLADPGGRTSAGESYVVFGRDPAAGGFPAGFELSSLLPANGGDGSAGFVLNGINTDDRSGRWVSAAGDVNGDGLDDVLVGALRGGQIHAGESYVIFGRDPAAAGFPAEFELSSLLPASGGDGSAGFVLKGIDAPDYSGVSVSAAGDLNGDGLDDVLVGAPRATPGGRYNAGESYVVFGRDRTTGGFPAKFELSSLLPANGGDGSAGFVLNGIDVGDFSGWSVSAAGDVNGDGLDDVLVGAWRAAPGGRSDAGESYVVFGRDPAAGGFPAEFELSSLLPANGGDGSAGFVLKGSDAFDYSGHSVSAAGDVNGDGLDDVLVGAWDATPGGRSAAGESYVVFGRDQRTGGFPAGFELSSLLPANGGDGSAGFVLKGIDARDASGWSVSAAGDVNGDGLDDVLIGSPSAGAGESYVVFGRDPAAGGFTAELELSSLLPANGGDGSAGFVLNGIDAGDVAGRVSAAGDVNGDGLDDVLIGAFYADPAGRSAAGESYVVFGRAAGSPTAPRLSIVNSPAAVEGDFLRFTVKLSQPVAANVTFDVTTIDGTALAPDDYQEKSGARLFAPGETERILWVPTVDDAMIEANETLQLKLSKPENAELGQASAEGIIVDNDDPSDWARLSVANARAAEGEYAGFVLSLSKPTKKDVKIALQTVDVTASANRDYESKSGTRLIPAGATQHTIYVKIADDDVVEGQEEFRLRVEVRSNNAVVADGDAMGTISDR